MPPEFAARCPRGGTRHPRPLRQRSCSPPHRTPGPVLPMGGGGKLTLGPGATSVEETLCVVLGDALLFCEDMPWRRRDTLDSRSGWGTLLARTLGMGHRLLAYVLVGRPPHFSRTSASGPLRAASFCALWQARSGGNPRQSPCELCAFPLGPIQLFIAWCLPRAPPFLRAIAN